MKKINSLRRLLLLSLFLTNAVMIFNLNAQQGWESLEPLDFQRGRLRSCVIDNMIYVFGGENTKGVYIDSVDAYNTETNEWTDLPPMPEGLIETNVGVINDTIYVVGGWSNVNQDYKTTNSTVAFDPEEGIWLVRKNCLEATGSNASCILNDTLYILGGKEGYYSTDVRKAWFYDACGDTWDSIPDMIYGHCAGSACALDGKIYVIGGGTMLTLPTNPVQAERFDGEKWEPIADMPVPVLHHFNVIHDNKILVFGGDSGAYDHQSGHETNLIQEYDPSTNSWKLYNTMPFKRSAMTGEIVGDSLYLMGGYSSNDRIPSNAVSEVWRFNLDSLQEGCVEVIIQELSDSLAIGDSVKLDVEVLPSDFANKSVIWSSDNESIAKVTEEGYVKGIGAGTATITAQLKYGGCSDSYNVTVVDTISGIGESSFSGISIYPVPASDWLFIKSEYQGINTCIITSMSGQVIFREEIEGSSHQIDLSSFQKGIYIISIRSKEFVTTRKIIKL
jgi:N-acetylneuraminic acid mutarotase